MSTELAHIILYVSDVRRSVLCYADLLGVKCDLSGLEPDTNWFSLNVSGISLAFHAGGQGKFGADAPKLGFRSSDLEADLKKLRRLGIIISLPRTPVDGVVVVDCEDYDGNRFSIETW